jgi:catechol 2,3-dioxygenase-like lactoylglutathione lyase family enzyme
MKPRITVITIGVDNLDRALRFYRDGLGLPTEGIVGSALGDGAVAFFDLQAGVKLAIWLRRSIARDAELPEGPPSSTEFTLGHNVSTRHEVDAVIAEAERAGAVIVTRPHETLWGGYAGYFRDPDGHLWEAVWNPDLTVED